MNLNQQANQNKKPKQNPTPNPKQLILYMPRHNKRWGFLTFSFQNSSL